MKKILSIVLLISTLLLLFSCKLQKPSIENYEWKMRYVMHGEDNQLIVDAVDKEDSAHPKAKIIDMTLTAKNGKLTVTDVTNNKIYEGTYTLDSVTPDGTNYSVTIDGRSGYAGVAMTVYADGTKEPTLPINLGDHSLYFYAN